MNNLFKWLLLAKPFLEEAYTVALLVKPSVAKEVRDIVDAIERLANAPVETNAPIVAIGLAGIKSYGEAVIKSLHNVLSDTTLTQEEKNKQAQDLVNSLSDDTKVYQAKHGKDAEALANFKVDAQKLADEIKG